ncbi:hypothetical protein L579_1375 [Pantoea sp. AS-PWVM4]|nr:hypothetical protein L579_1375 [Pantoea sp. AS-PWVM4]
MPRLALLMSFSHNLYSPGAIIFRASQVNLPVAARFIAQIRSAINRAATGIRKAV